MRNILFLISVIVVFVSPVGANESIKRLRIVSLMPSNTEVVFDLGAGSDLVGVTTFCDYPPEAAAIDKIGDFIHPNIEKILSLKPDVVLAGQWSTSTVAARLRKLGLKVVEVRLPATLEEIYGTIHDVAREIGREDEAEKIVADLKARVERIAKASQGRGRKPRAFIHIDEPNWTVSKRSFISDAIERCGLVNVFRDLPAAGAQVSLEAVIVRDPEVLIFSRQMNAALLSQPGWKRVNAVRNGRILSDIEHDCLNRPTPRIVLGMERISEELLKMNFK